MNCARLRGKNLACWCGLSAPAMSTTVSNWGTSDGQEADAGTARMTARRKGYYPRIVSSGSQGSAPEAPESLKPLIGADAIAAALQISPEQLKSLLYPARRREQIGLPARKLPGLGLAAERDELLTWWRSYLTGQGVADRL